MSPIQDQRARDLYNRVRATPEARRPALINEECAGDAELRNALNSWLANDDQATLIDRTPAPARPGNEPASDTFDRIPQRSSRLGKRLGKFHIVREIAQGGMGIVYEAMEDKPRRTVALKLVRSGFPSRSALRRFEYEAQILARLRHPGIAQIYEAGVHVEDGERIPFFAMEYIPNALPLDEYARSKELSTHDRLALFAKVCDAVHHGHQKGVIHRDLKPSNILVDSDGQPKVIDFGVARATDSDLAVTTLQTKVGQIVGTLQYMSPEQCAADPHDIDIRSDVYALGVILYELLCGRLPYSVDGLSIPQAVLVVKEQRPARPTATNQNNLPEDVETIVKTAMEKDRGRRYQSALALEQDVRHFLNHEPIIAHPRSLLYQLRMSAYQHRSIVVSLAAIITGLVLGIAVTGGGWFKSHELVTQLLGKTAMVCLSGHSKAVVTGNFDSGGTRVLTASFDGTARLWNPETGDELKRFTHVDTVYTATFSPDGQRVLTGSDDGTAKLWSLKDDSKPLQTLVHPGKIRSAEFSPDGNRVVTASSNGTAAIWSVGKVGASATPRWLEGHKGAVTRALFSSSGAWVVTGSADATARIWDASTGACLTKEGLAHDDEVRCIAVSPVSDLFVTGSMDGKARLWTFAPGRITPLHVWKGGEGAGMITYVAFSADGASVVTGCMDGTVRVWSVAGDSCKLDLRHTPPVVAVEFSPTGNISVALKDGATHLYRADGSELAPLPQTGTIGNATFRQDGGALITTSTDKNAFVWSFSRKL